MNLRHFLAKFIVFLCYFLITSCAFNSGNQPVLVQVISKGSGTTPDESLKNAMFNAIRNVTGEMMIGQDNLINYSLVEKRINYSDGVIVSYKELSLIRNQYGLFDTTIQATVNKNKLTIFLKPSFANSHVDGSSIYASGITAKQKFDNQNKIVNEFINKFWSDGLQIKITDIQQSSPVPDLFLVTINFFISVKEEYISNFINVMDLAGIRTGYNDKGAAFSFWALNGVNGSYPFKVNFLDRNGRLIKDYCMISRGQLPFFNNGLTSDISFNNATGRPVSSRYEMEIMIDDLSSNFYDYDRIKSEQLRILDKVQIAIDFSCYSRCNQKCIN